jgi:hypothetical protein
MGRRQVNRHQDQSGRFIYGPSGVVGAHPGHSIGTMLRRVLLSAVVAAIFAGCSGPVASPLSSSRDAQRVWCGSHPVATINAAVSIGIGPSRLSHKAGIEQARLDGDPDRAVSNTLV